MLTISSRWERQVISNIVKIKKQMLMQPMTR